MVWFLPLLRHAPPNHLVVTSFAEPVLIGTAGWSIPAPERMRFAAEGSVLERYARVFSAVEINSSFYRPHQAGTYAKWAAATPATFRFSVKFPKQISHVAKLQDCAAELDKFLFESAHLGDKLGCLLLQLPAHLAFQSSMEQFFDLLRQRFHGAIACEPRHQSWLQPAGLKLLNDAKLWLVEADPSPFNSLDPLDPAPHYLRLHGSPRMYYSAYSNHQLNSYAARLKRTTDVAWCIFDNTASGAAIGNALTVKQYLR